MQFINASSQYEGGEEEKEEQNNENADSWKKYDFSLD
jgi:hypothetical protein